MPKPDDYDSVEYVGLKEEEARQLVDVYNSQGAIERLDRLLTRRAKRNEEISMPTIEKTNKQKQLNTKYKSINEKILKRKKILIKPIYVHASHIPTVLSVELVFGSKQ